MVHIDVYPCASCGLEYRFRDGTDNKLCAYCDPTASLRSKTKESRIKELLKKELTDVPFVHDRSISSIEMIDKTCVCGRFRQDFFFDMDTHVVILEVDENQHSTYDASCKRVRELHVSDVLGHPTTFVCYNPDAYHIDGTMVCVSTACSEQRLVSVLRDLLYTNTCVVKGDSYLCETVFLYYDEN